MFKSLTDFLMPMIISLKCNYFKIKQPLKSRLSNLGDSKKIFYMMLPTHGNIGDQAIAVATLKMLEDQFSDYKIVTINDDEIYSSINAIKEVISPRDLIFIHGGGNMGDLYLTAERQRLCIVKNFPNNKIISMTQTAFFSDSNQGRRQLARSRKIYNSHEDLILFAREKKTFDFMKSNFDNAHVKLIPDIVFYLYNPNNKIKGRRNFITTCLRSDEESILSSPHEVIDCISKIDKEMFIYDTYVARQISNNIDRVLEVRSLMNQFRRSKIVVTDRMHGMVLSAITGTPCIVTKSMDDKIVGTYQWIKDLNYVDFVDSFDNKILKEKIESLCNLERISTLDIKSKYLMDIREQVFSN